ncbi:MAG: cyclic nucleotide-binding domain-containing protein [Myxococcota bacterium]|nr:cyclic nucleotide-binding domain-containing protein [Myxococcota bacterium]
MDTRPDSAGALELVFLGEYEQALRIATPILEASPSDLNAWYIAARCLVELGETELGLKNLEHNAVAYAHAGRPVLALSRAKELEALGGKEDKITKIVARLYSSSSKRVAELDPEPPPLPQGVMEPISGRVALSQVVDKAKQAVAVAWGQSLTEDSSGPLPFVPLWSALSEEDFSALARSLERIVVKPDEVIIAQNVVGDAMFAIAEGEVEVMRIDDGEGAPTTTVLLARLAPGAFFGEMSLVSAAPRAAEVRASSTCVLLRATKQALEELATKEPQIGDMLVAFCHARMLENVMRVSPVLSPVPASRRAEVIARFGTDFKESGEVIIAQDEEGLGLYVIVSGKVLVHKNMGGKVVQLATLGPGDLFGEISLIMRRKSTATVTAVEDTALLFLPRQEFASATREYPELLKGAYDIALDRELKNNSILAQGRASEVDIVLV